MSFSQVRQNYHDEAEAGINKQINLELYASYVYLSMVSALTLASQSFQYKSSFNFSLVKSELLKTHHLRLLLYQI